MIMIIILRIIKPRQNFTKSEYSFKWPNLHLAYNIISCMYVYRAYREDHADPTSYMYDHIDYLL